MKSIRSRDNTYVKHLIGLAHSARERKKSGLTVLDGAHLVAAFLDQGQVPQSIAFAESALGSAEAAALRARVANTDCLLYQLADGLVTQASSLDSPASIMAIVQTPAPMPIPAKVDVLVLEGVQDPGNVGSLLRSAAAAGVKHVALGVGTAFAWSPKVLRAGQGAHFALNIVEQVDVLKLITHTDADTKVDTRTVALVVDGPGVVDLYDLDLSGPTTLLIGNEGAGLSAEVARRARHRATIPMPGKIESLNAAASGAIALFELVRQRRKLRVKR